MNLFGEAHEELELGSRRRRSRGGTAYRVDMACRSAMNDLFSPSASICETFCKVNKKELMKIDK